MSGRGPAAPSGPAPDFNPIGGVNTKWRGGQGLIDIQPIGFGARAAVAAIAASLVVAMEAHKAWVGPYLEHS